MAYPITFEADVAERRSRLTTFFRALMVIPHLLVLLVYGLVAVFTIVGAWFALVITGRYPQGLYTFNSGVLRYITRVYAYMYLLTDAYPPFGTGESTDYPVRLAIAPPQPQYSRLKALFRIIVGIPVLIINYVMNLILGFVTIIAWFWIVITGKESKGLHAALSFTLSYNAKANGYFYLLTERYPPFSDDDAGTLTAAPAAGPLDPPAPTGPSTSLGSDIGLPDLPPPPPREDGPGGLTSGDPLR